MDDLSTRTITPSTPAAGPAAAPGTGSRTGLSPADRPPLRLPDFPEVPSLTALTSPAASSGIERDDDAGLVPVELAPGRRAWLVTRYETLVAFARDPRLSAATDTWTGHAAGTLPPDSPVRAAFPPVGQPAVEALRGAEHQRLREPLDLAIAAIDQGELARLTRRACDELVDAFADRGTADLIREYADLIPHRTIGVALGFDAATSRQVFDDAEPLDVHDASFLLTGQASAVGPNGGPTPAAVLARHPAYQGVAESALGLSTLVSYARDGLAAWLAQILYAVLADRRFATRTSHGRLGTDEALDEVLWAASPVRTLAPRIADQDFVHDGVLVERGDAVLLGVGVAVGDPALRGDDAWTGAGNRGHMAFGIGEHACPAGQPARIVVRTAVETLRNRVAPVLAMEPEDIEWRPGLRFVRPESLLVTFEPLVEPLDRDSAFS